MLFNSKFLIQKMNIQLPELCLVLLVGASSSGKSTLARKHFLPSQIVSSDAYRAMVSDDENNLDATKDAFDVLHFVVDKRLKRGVLTVVDATNLKAADRKSLVDLAKKHHIFAVALVLQVPEKELLARHQQRADRHFDDYVIRRQFKTLRQQKYFKQEGIRFSYFLQPEDIEALSVTLIPLFSNKKHLKGAFDIIGDVHGCYAELVMLLQKLGYQVEQNQEKMTVTPPTGRTAIFVGDLTDRGENSAAVLRLVMQMVADGNALCVCGNHDDKLRRYLEGKKVNVNHGLETTVEQLEKESAEFKEEVRTFLDGLSSHYILDGGKLVIAHAGLAEHMQGRTSGAVSSFCLYGQTTGETDEFGLPVRYPWAKEYRGKAQVVYGHTPVPEPLSLNNTLNIDTGCVFGGKLTALRYPSQELISVEAQKVYATPVRPLYVPEETHSAQQIHDEVLYIEDVLGKRFLDTKLQPKIQINEENAATALEVMSRFATHPQWLMYLPPTMSPTETSALPNFLEHPAEAFAYFRKKGQETVICQEKHMGSRAVVVLCKTDAVAVSRFGMKQPSAGVCYTRTGRAFFKDEKLAQDFLLKLRTAFDGCGFWERFETDWVCLDAELMPWSAKAQELIKKQYAATGSAGQNTYTALNKVIQQAQNRGLVLTELRQEIDEKTLQMDKFVAAYQQYCAETKELEGLKLAPFHLLATEGKTYFDQSHEWHMSELAKICDVLPNFLVKTAHKLVNLNDATSVQSAMDWWLNLTQNGGEGMVIKPLAFIPKDPDGALIQPALKCRGKEYLRIIYGADYDTPSILCRLKERSVHKKRNLALKEFALGIESIERFVHKLPLRKVHECVFGVLALESEGIDPRL